jgi:hypothetical protein
MATSGSWKIAGTINGYLEGPATVSATIVAPTTAVDVRQSLVAVGAGFNAITVPTGATAVLIEPPAANAQTITAKGVTGDTGIALSPTQPSVLSLGTSPSLGLTVGGAVTIELVFM